MLSTTTTAAASAWAGRVYALHKTKACGTPPAAGHGSSPSGGRSGQDDSNTEEVFVDEAVLVGVAEILRVPLDGEHSLDLTGLPSDPAAPAQGIRSPV